MADAPKIILTGPDKDSLKSGSGKINLAIDNANEALSTATTAKNTADIAKSTADNADSKADTALANSESTQAQLNAVVIDGDSSPQIAQALADTPYTTLRQKHDAVDAQLADIAINPKNKNGLLNSISDAVATNREIHLYGGVYEINDTIIPNGKLTIRGFNDAEIKLTVAKTNVIQSAHKLKLVNVKVNGNGLANNGINTTGEMPHLDGVEISNVVKDCLITDVSTSTGELFLNKCYAHHAERGFIGYGNRLSTNVFFKDCKTSDITGLLYYFERHKKVEVYGGVFKGGANSNANAGYNCDEVSVDGGAYTDIYRGATIGQDVKRYSVKNTIAKNCTFAGVSVDTRLGDGTIPDGFGDVQGNISEGCNFAVRIQAKGFYLDNNISKGHTSANGAYYITNSEGVIGENVAEGTNNELYTFTVSSVVRFGKKEVSSNSYPIKTDTGSTISFKEIQNVSTTNAIIKATTDVVLVDASAGEVVVKLPNPLYFRSFGKMFKIIKVDSTANNVVVQRQGASTINGVTEKRLTTQYEKLDLMMNGDNFLIA